MRFCAVRASVAPGVFRALGRLAAMGVALGIVAASLEAANPELKALSPAGGRRGADCELLLKGSRLGDAQQLIFYEPGISAASCETQDGQVKVRLSIAPDCRLGMHGFRLRTASGISNLRTFSVGALPEIAEQEPNNDFNKPQPIALETTVTGVVTDEDVDYFAVEAKKGERLTAEIEGLRLGFTLFDPYVAIFNTGRFELARSDDSALLKQDGVASLIVPEDGTYIIQVRESAYDGNSDSFYRLHVGRFPRPTAVFPSGGRAGETVSIRWLGDVTGPRVESVSLPAAVQNDFSLTPRDEFGVAPSGLPFRLAEFGNVLEAEPNDSLETATPAQTTPIALNGVIERAGDLDFFKFHAVKGQRIDLQVYARSLGSPLDSVIDLYKVGGKRVAGNDDTRGPDSQIRFTAEDGDYVISIRDHLRAGGPDYVYRIELTLVETSLVFGLPERVQYFDTTISIPQGNRAAVMVSAKRENFGDELRLALKDLPPGVQVETVPMPGNRTEVPVFFSAAQDAPLGTSLADVVGLNPKKDNAPLSSEFIQRTLLVRGRNNTTAWEHVTRRMPVTVTQATPFRIEVVEPKAPLVQGGAANLKVVATRQPDFNAPIQLQMLYNPPGVGSSHVSIGEGQTEALLPLTADNGAECQKWPIAILAEATVGDGPALVASQLANLEVAAPYLALTPQAASVEQGNEVEMAIKVEKKKDFEGAAKVELLGAPHEVASEPREIAPDATELVFRLKTTDKSPVGLHKSLLCRTTYLVAGEPVTQITPAGELRIDAPLPPRAKTQGGSAPTPMASAAPSSAPPTEKRLTRLERLRLERQSPAEARPGAASGANASPQTAPPQAPADAPKP